MISFHTVGDRPDDKEGTGAPTRSDMPFDEARRCEGCGALGAFDLSGAHLCAACVDDSLRGLKSPGQSRT